MFKLNFLILNFDLLSPLFFYSANCIVVTKFLAELTNDQCTDHTHGAQRVTMAVVTMGPGTQFHTIS